MSEIYADPNNIFDLPVTSDNSLSHEQLIKLFSRQFRPFLNSSINKYLLSCGNNWLCIEPIRTKYRVIGQYNDMQYVKRCANFDIYHIGTLTSCIDYFLGVIGL